MKKEVNQERINNILWSASEVFRGTVESEKYKDYILALLFVKYLSDTFKEVKKEIEEKYDDEVLIEKRLNSEKFKLDDESTFEYMFSKRNDPEIGSIMNKVLDKIEELNESNLKGIFGNINFDSKENLGERKLRNSLLKKLLETFNNDDLDLSPSRVKNSDVMGNAYEYLIKYFASTAGKKGGEFYTPKEASCLLAKLVKLEENDKIYDPTMGSGALSITLAKEVNKFSIYGQEKNGSTFSLARMNMFLNGIMDAKLAWGDTISDPQFMEKKFDKIAANPPYSLKYWEQGFSSEEFVDEKGKKISNFKMKPEYDPYRRFDWGVPPSTKGDYAFILHILHCLAENGTAGVVLPHGVLFRGAQEGKIRKKIIESNLIDAVISLPENIFYGTGIPTCIIIFKKNRKKEDVLFIDASSYYEKVGKKNKLINIDEIVEAYDNRKNVDKFSSVIDLEKIKENDYNLNIPRYVDTFEEEEIVDLEKNVKKVKEIKDRLKVVENKMDEYLKELGLEQGGK